MSDINEEQKRLYKRAEENDKEQVCLKVSMPLFEEKELEIFDNNIHNIIEEYSKLHLEKKEQILTQRIIIKQEQEINELQEENEKLNLYIEFYKSIIDKALKWINENKYYFPSPNELINILKGDNK